VTLHQSTRVLSQQDIGSPAETNQKGDSDQSVAYPSLVGAVHQRGEVLYPAVGVRVLEQNAAHVLPTEVHLMGQLQNGLHPDVARFRGGGGGFKRY